MSIIGWIVLGIIAGFLGGKIVNANSNGLLMNMALGIVGAIVGGFIFNMFGAQGVTGFNIYSMIVSVVGAVVVLWAYNAFAGGRST
jgi:uncharacterized membrane protein YeaQ/YmgE (transglycosylase-associated protein family)